MQISAKMAKMAVCLMTVCVGVAIAGQSAYAQPKSDDVVVYKKKTIIDFSDILIEGELTKPEGSYVVSRKLSRFSTLIRLRENFVPELLRSANEL